MATLPLWNAPIWIASQRGGFLLTKAQKQWKFAVKFQVVSKRAGELMTLVPVDKLPM
jgi:hypothetical protein